MLSAGTAKAVKGIAPDVIAALHRNLLDRIGHVFDGDLDEAVGDFFGFAAADLLRQIGEGVSYRMGIERKVLRSAENLRKEFGNELSDHYVGIRDGQRAAAPIAFRARIGAR